MRPSLVRTQIQLTEGQAAVLKRIAAERGVSMAALIRDAVDLVVGGIDPEAQRRRALSVVGKHASGAADISSDHDRYLDEAYRT